jgi:alpha-galactosidase
MPRSVKIGVIGAGSGVFSLGLVKDLCLNENLRESQVTFMDVNPERLEIVSRLAWRYAEEFGSARCASRRRRIVRRRCAMPIS